MQSGARRGSRRLRRRRQGGLDMRRTAPLHVTESFMAVVSGRLRRVVRLVVRCAQLAALLLAAGLLSGVLYETVGAWQDNRVIARVGRSVDIGGRSLNIACAGDGTPTVV